MHRNTVIVASAFCFITGLLMLVWLQNGFTPPLSDICDIRAGVVRVRGEYRRGRLIGNCSVKVKFYKTKPEQGSLVEVVGEVEDWGLTALGWQQVQ